jgi:hypothetical protein
LTQVATMGSVQALWRNTRGTWPNLRHAFRQRQPAGSICSGCGGRMAFAVHAVAAASHGLCEVCCSSVRLAQQAVAVEPVPLDRILHPEAKAKRNHNLLGLPE